MSYENAMKSVIPAMNCSHEKNQIKNESCLSEPISAIIKIRIETPDNGASSSKQEETMNHIRVWVPWSVDLNTST